MTRTRLLSLLALSLLTTACADTLPVSPGIPQPHAVATITDGSGTGDAAAIDTLSGIPPAGVAVGGTLTVTTTITGVTATEVTVEWGDGTVEQVAIVNDTVQASHVYTTPGTYEIYVYDGPTYTSSSVTVVETVATEPAPAIGGTGSCTRTQGYWKQRHHAWPTSYDRDGVFYGSGDTWQRVLNAPPKNGNAYLRLAHQYIAAVLNRASLASTPAHVVTAIDAAHAYFMGSAPVGFDAGATAELLDRFNNGQEGVPHCG